MLASQVVIAFAPLVPFADASWIFLGITLAVVAGLVGLEIQWRRRRGGRADLEVGFEPFKLRGRVVQAQSRADIGARPRKTAVEFRLVTVPLRLINNGGQPATGVRITASIPLALQADQVHTACESGQTAADGILEGKRAEDGTIRFDFTATGDVTAHTSLALNCGTWIPPGPCAFYVDYKAEAGRSDSAAGRLLVNVLA